MCKLKTIVLYGIISVLAAAGCKEKSVEPPEEEVPKPLTELPFHEVKFEDLSEFTVDGSNWKTVGSVFSDFNEAYNLRSESGVGVLVNTSAEDKNANLYTAFEHGDIEFKTEFLMSKNSSSGIYLQGRYKLQLYDSWGVETPTVNDCGSIAEQHDESQPESQKSLGGYPPSKNAFKAPGLWQQLYIKFRAPRFDAEGNKIENALFEKVVLNGLVIHENVAITGPTRSILDDATETASATLMIESGNGPVAFRNMAYKSYGLEKVTTANMHYSYYEIETPVRSLPNFETLTAVASGKVDTINVDAMSRRNDGIAFKFNGELKVPRGGDYLFLLTSDDGSRLFVDDELIIDYDGNHQMRTKTVLVNLSEGVHSIAIDYFNDVWNKGLILEYEGPNQKRTILQGVSPYKTAYKKEALLIEAEGMPEMVRSFAMYNDEKRTHTISVGSPKRVHYTYDLQSGALLKAWRGGFADVTEMWQDRGIAQVLVPQEMAMEFQENVLAMGKNPKEEAYAKILPEEIMPKGYTMMKNGLPMFKYQHTETQIFDGYQATEDGRHLQRTIKVEGPSTFYCRVGIGKRIEKVNQEYYSVDGQFFLRNDGNSKPFIRDIDGQQELLYEVKRDNEVTYSLLW